MKLIRPIILAFTTGWLPAHATSFDCANARHKVEKIICSDMNLSKLDEDLGSAFTTAIKDENASDSIRREQKQWLKERNACSDAACLKEKYQNRLSVLTNGTKSAVATAATRPVLKKSVPDPNAGWDFVIHRGEGVEDWVEDGDDPMCLRIKDYMNKVARTWEVRRDLGPRNYCSAAIGLAPFLSEPPWEELDSRKYEELIARLLRFNQDQDAYFKGPSPGSGYDESYFHKRAHDFVTAGGRLQHWRVRLIEILYFPPDGNNKPAPPGLQDVVQLRYTHTYSASEKNASFGCEVGNWSGQVFLVTDNLSEPLKYIDSMQSLFLYRGEPVLVSYSDTEIAVRSPYHSRLDRNCRLTYPDNEAIDKRKQ